MSSLGPSVESLKNGLHTDSDASCSKRIHLNGGGTNQNYAQNIFAETSASNEHQQLWSPKYRPHLPVYKFKAYVERALGKEFGE
jgi:hypothetical protein